MLAKFQQLYDVEDRAKTLSADERRALRQAEAAPVWASLGEWLAGKSAAAVLPEEPLRRSAGLPSQPLGAAAGVPRATDDCRWTITTSNN